MVSYFPSAVPASSRLLDPLRLRRQLSLQALIRECPSLLRWTWPFHDLKDSLAYPRINSWDCARFFFKQFRIRSASIKKGRKTASGRMIRVRQSPDSVQQFLCQELRFRGSGGRMCKSNRSSSNGIATNSVSMAAKDAAEIPYDISADRKGR